MLLNAFGFTEAYVSQHLVQQFEQYSLTFGNGHCQLKAKRRFATDVKTIEFELAQAPYAGSQVTDHRIDLIRGQRLQGRTDVGQCDDVQVRVLRAQKLMGGVVFNDADPEAVEVFDVFR